MKIKVNFKCLLLFGMFLISSIVWNPVLAQIPPETAISIKINTPADLARVVRSGDLTIYGTSSDDDTKNCQVYADWNDMKPMQNVTPNGPKGNADYSKWSFTYTGSYHNIVEGPNELTSKITCYDQGQNASSKFYSINVTGTTDGNENTNNPVQTSNENTNNDVGKVLPVKNSNSNSADNTVQTSNENTNNDVSKVLPVKNNNSNSADNTVQTSNENTNNDVSKVLPVKNNNSKGTYKILPLYSESNEESTRTVASQVKDKTEEVASTDTSESQVSDSEDEALSTDTNTYSTSESEQQEKTGETTTTNMNKSQVTDSGDEALSTNTNTYFIFEPEQEEDEELTGNNDNTISNSPQTENPLPNYNHNDGNSVFGLNFKNVDDDTENKLENRMENLKERIDDRMHLSDFIG